MTEPKEEDNVSDTAPTIATEQTPSKVVDLTAYTRNQVELTQKLANVEGTKELRGAVHWAQKFIRSAPAVGHGGDHFTQGERDMLQRLIDCSQLVVDLKVNALKAFFVADTMKRHPQHEWAGRVANLEKSFDTFLDHLAKAEAKSKEQTTNQLSPQS